ncbi:MAG: hypothetical protein K6E19_04365 [Lachnospiraceae bacterium]|nr:hypothetical protein [Lachnospiraceae bacterium]
MLGDNPAIGLILYEHRFLYDWIQAPSVTEDMHYVHTGLNRPIRVYKAIDSRLILEYLVSRLKLFARLHS